MIKHCLLIPQFVFCGLRAVIFSLDELQELLHDSHLRDNSYVPSGPGADTIKEYRRQLVASEKLMPTVKDAYGSRLVTPLPLSTGQSSSTAQKQQCLSTPGPVESMPTSRLEDGLTTDRPENNELTTSTSQEGLTTGMASETSGRHEFVAAEGKKPPDIRKEEEESKAQINFKTFLCVVIGLTCETFSHGSRSWGFGAFPQN